MGLQRRKSKGSRAAFGSCAEVSAGPSTPGAPGPESSDPEASDAKGPTVGGSQERTPPRLPSFRQRIDSAHTCIESDLCKSETVSAKIRDEVSRCEQKLIFLIVKNAQWNTRSRALLYGKIKGPLLKSTIPPVSPPLPLQLHSQFPQSGGFSAWNSLLSPRLL